MVQLTRKSNRVCRVCRLRRVKCDGQRPACRNCSGLGVQCAGEEDGVPHRIDVPPSSVDDVYRAAGLEKRRVGSCEACRRSKSRCSKTKPSCEQCGHKGIICRYGPKYARQHQGHEELQELRRQDSRQPIVSQNQGLQRMETPATSDVAHVASQEHVLPDGQHDGGVHALTPATWSSEPVAGESRQTALNFLDGLDSHKFRLLTEIYFSRVSTLRCLGFIHKPCFFLSVDQGTVEHDYGEPLLYIICALAAPFYYEESEAIIGNPRLSEHSQEWANHAQSLVLRDLGTPSLKSLMAMLLICEHALRSDQHALAFMMIGCCCRAIRLLGLNEPQKPHERNLSHQAEVERRLVWMAFILDSTIGSGVNENLEWKNVVPCVPLPSSDHDFMSSSISSESPRYLEVTDDLYDTSHFSLRSHIAYQYHLRTRVLRLIRTYDPNDDISDSRSSFLTLVRQLEQWYKSFPESLKLSELNTYVQKEMGTLGAYFSLHMAYHCMMCDLTRVSLPGYNFPLAKAFKSASCSFKLQCQDRCRFHADEISKLVRIGLRCSKQAFDDDLCLVAVFEATKILIVHTATCTQNSEADRSKAKESIRNNLRVEEGGGRNADRLKLYSPCLLPLLEHFEFRDIGLKLRESQGLSANNDTPLELSGPPDTCYLSNLSSFRRAKWHTQGRKESLSAPHPSPGSATDTMETGTEPPIGSLQKPPSAAFPEQVYDLGSAHQSLMANQPRQGLTHQNTASPQFLSTGTSIVDSSWSDEHAQAPPTSLDAYTRLASDMSGYLTWQSMETPPWMNFTS